MVRGKGSRCYRWAGLAAVLSALAAIGCGGSSPASPTDSNFPQGTRLTGTFASGAGQGLALTAYSQGSFEGMTVHVEEDPAIETAVGADGSFTLRGLPEDRFTLVFMRNGNEVGEVPFEGVLPNSEITIVVQMTDRDRVRLVSQKRTGIGHGDLELEGIVDEVSPGGHDNEGTLIVNGYTVTCQPGVTAIREGNRARTMQDIHEGNRVHVKGEGQETSILAHEVKLQNDDDTTDGTDSDQCPNGGKVNQKIVLEGYVTSGTTSRFTMRATGRTENIEVAFNGTPTCVGQAGKNSDCTVVPDDKVNVKGILVDCSHVDADEVKIQKKG
jgi:hypothetical protein